MLFSVIVPVYGVEKYLRQCIDSILGQTFSDFELILVDDGSTDNCPAICDEYAVKDKRINVIHKENEGVVIARQTGVENAKGEYLVFVDGDDYVALNCLELINEHIGVDVVRFGYIRETKNGVVKCPLPERKGYYSRENIENEIFHKLIQTEDAKYFSPAVWGSAFRKELFESNMLKDSSLSIGEDGACVIPSIYNAQSMYIMEDCLYYYRLNLSSATKGGKVFKWEGPEIIARHLAAKINLSEFDFQEQLYRKTVHELFSVVVSQFNRKEKSVIIRKEIDQNLQNSFYCETIEKAEFRHSIKAELMLLALRHRWYNLIKMYGKLK